MLERGLIICALCLAAAGAAQTPDAPPVEESDFVITTESNLVVVPLHVYDRKKSVNGLGKEAFELREDCVLQEIAFVEGPAAEGADLLAYRANGDHLPDRFQLQRHDAGSLGLHDRAQHHASAL